MVRLAYSLGNNMDPDVLIERAKKIESAGFEIAFSNELFASPFVPLAAVAPQTERLKLGCSIAYAFTRSPLETAITMLDLDQITRGRFILGLGSGVRRLNENWHGVSNYGRPAPHMKECVRAVKAILDGIVSGNPVQFQGEYYNLDMRGWDRDDTPVNGTIPIYMAAVREGMCRAVGDVADGVLGFPVWTPRWLKEVVLPNIAIGLKRSGRKRSDIDIWGSLTVAITNDKKQGYMDARSIPGFYATIRTYEPVFTHHGFEKEVAEIREAFMNLQGFGDEVLAPISEEMAGQFVAVGSADEVRKRVNEMAELCDGVDLNVPSDSVPPERVAEYEKAMFETFAS